MKKAQRKFDAQAARGGMYLTAARKQETKAEMVYNNPAASKKHTQMAKALYSQSSKVVDKGMKTLRTTQKKQKKF